MITSEIKLVLNYKLFVNRPPQKIENKSRKSVIKPTATWSAFFSLSLVLFTVEFLKLFDDRAEIRLKLWPRLHRNVQATLKTFRNKSKLRLNLSFNQPGYWSKSIKSIQILKIFHCEYCHIAFLLANVVFTIWCVW